MASNTESFDGLASSPTPLDPLVDSVEKDQRFLERHAKHFLSETDNNVSFKDNFANLLILEATNDRNLVSIEIPPRTWNFFGGPPVLTTSIYPDDLDTTSLATTILKPDLSTTNSLMDEMLQYTSPEGIIQLYYDPNRPRVEPEVCTNILTLFYTYNRGHQVQPTLNHVLFTLDHLSQHESRYYHMPEPFFYYLGRLLRCSTDEDLHSRLKPTLRERLSGRIGTEIDPLALAIRVLLCDELGVENEVDFDSLMRLQEEDGSWGFGWIYRFGKTGTRIGNRYVMAALAVKAIEARRTSRGKEC